MAEVEELCATITVVNRGTVVFSGTVDELRQRAPAAVHAIRTSDDRIALDLASRHPGVRATTAADGGLQVAADGEALDAYVIALGRAGVAVRVLKRRARSLESLFLDLTRRGGADAPAAASIDARDGLHAGAGVS
jgi:ABC-2 type transport system ATP-binding protein